LIREPQIVETEIEAGKTFAANRCRLENDAHDEIMIYRVIRDAAARRAGNLSECGPG
jgi:hypothetical protein